MHIFLHIGTEKTGTTSIQQFLHDNRQVFRDAGTLIPASPGLGNHRKFPAMFLAEDHVDDFLMAQNLHDPQKRRAAVTRWKQAFLAETAHAKPHKVIISSEHLHSRLRDVQEIHALARFLRRLFTCITVILYIRDPLATAVSLYSTAIKAGNTFDAPLPPSDPYWNSTVNHRQTIEKWGGVFGLENLRIRLFENGCVRGNSLFSDFLETCGEPDRECRFPAPANKTLDQLGLALLARVNDLIPAMLPDNRPNPARKGVLEYFEQNHSAGPRYVPTPELAHAYETAFRDSNEWVRQRFFPERATLFTAVTYPPAQPLEFTPTQLDNMAQRFSQDWPKTEYHPPR